MILCNTYNNLRLIFLFYSVEEKWDSERLKLLASDLEKVTELEFRSRIVWLYTALCRNIELRYKWALHSSLGLFSFINVTCMYSLGSQNPIRCVSKKCVLLSFPPQPYFSEVITFSSCLCVLLVAVSLLPGTVVLTWGCLCLPESTGQYQETFLPVMSVGSATGRLMARSQECCWTSYKA